MHHMQHLVNRPVDIQHILETIFYNATPNKPQAFHRATAPVSIYGSTAAP